MTLLASVVSGVPAAASPTTSELTISSSSSSRANAISTFTPKTGVLFNNPTGPAAEQYALKTNINAAIDGSPAGSTIRVATYSFGFNDTADKLIAAQARGVNVRVLIDAHTTTPQTDRLTAALGKDIHAGSFVQRCVQGCMSSNPSVMHAKIYNFSAVGSVKLVSMVASANLTASSASGSWNNLNTVVGNSTVYASLSGYFDDMVRDVDDSSYFHTTTSGAKKLYYFPQSLSHSPTLTIMDALNRVSCSGSSAGYGSKGHTVIRIAMFQWAASRLDLATKVHQLRERGCVVEVVTNGPIAGAGVLKELLKKSHKYGVMPVYDALYDFNNDGVAERYLHDKVVTISGKWNGNSRSTLVFTGSQNFTVNSTSNNNEIIYRMTDAATYDSYSRHIVTVRSTATKRLTSVPKAKLSADGVNELVDDDLVGNNG